MKGAILKKGMPCFTRMRPVFDAIGQKQLEYNWLITDLWAYPNSEAYDALVQTESLWLTGAELTEMVLTEDFQWIDAVLSGFPKDIAKEQALAHPLPTVDSCIKFWKNPVSIQNPLAEIEIVPCDSSFVIFISKHADEVNMFRNAFPLSEDLEAYNNR